MSKGADCKENEIFGNLSSTIANGAYNILCYTGFWDPYNPACAWASLDGLGMSGVGRQQCR